ncbi:mannitol-1-phosphate 5-dehydrogenase [Cryphonectria parasitica EP155]|uniref:Mannitol-1-phosphate 5-dehydrogenase n=1 Tax=Cryphonectria parasitica (strain ATCC 38755 / EP155) TaxID=660469 RepID=A0A9P4Y5I0_CRYP1|nr:mannitol-1-phosphate 5-dehydrogenase [Cryphonectria parasitica EP155]KAF3767302.1 mannitol-1-phosphate 5-dehydrogenase [Cryphonectria parasitica EP155]
MAATKNLKAVHFGAGNIGRGFVACFLHNSGYEVVFADVVPEVVDKLNNTKSYKVIEVGTEGTVEEIITNYRAINSRTHHDDLVNEIASADVVTCSVGPTILKFIAPVIAQGIQKRSDDMKPLAVIACENMINATTALAEHIKDPKNTPENLLEVHNQRVRYANSAIDRIVPAQDPDAGLNVKLEKFYEWVVEQLPFEGQHPAIDGINWVDHLEPYIERKLYTVNTGHATAAYHGYNRKKRTVYDALQDKEIMAEVKKALDNTSTLITSKHETTEEEQAAYVKKIISRIGNPHLEDAVERVGRAPLRKLGRKERFIGPAAHLAEMGEDCSGLLDAAEMAFRFQNIEGDDESRELAQIMASQSPDEIVSQVCGLQKSEKLYPMVVDIVKKVQADAED